MTSDRFDRAPSSEDTGERDEAVDLTRRRVVAALAASGVLSALPALLREFPLIERAHAATLDGEDALADAPAGVPDLTRDTLNGITVFFVPGPDPYSVQQGESTPEPGGLEAGAGEGLFQGLNFANPFVPNLSDVVAGVFNSTALAVNPGVSGPFQSPFSNLSFGEKAIVFAALEGNPASAPLAGILPLVVTFLTYGETAVFDPVTRTISGRPIGWDLSSYSGVSDGRDEFIGYFRNRRKAHA